MAFKFSKLPIFSFSSRCKDWRSRPFLKQAILAGLLAAALIAAFCWGRHGGLNQARAQSGLLDAPYGMQSNSERSRHVVAYICGNIPVTREELGEYLIERVGAERLDFLVNRKIIEKVCADRHIRITDAEINAQLAEDLKAFKCTEREFVNNILKRYNKTLFEWKEDVIRPKLALQRFVQGTIAVDEQDIRKGFEARYGPKVECLLIHLSKEQEKDKYDIWKRASRGHAEFVEEAKKVNPGPLAAEGGKIPPIHKHFGDPNVEREAFNLKPGEITSIISMLDKSTVILHCVKHLPADTTKSFEQERMGLHREIYEAKVAQAVAPVFNEMRRAAAPQIFLKRDFVPADIATLVNQAPALPGPPPASVTDSPLPAVPPGPPEVLQPKQSPK